jgi:hypothetical protein
MLSLSSSRIVRFVLAPMLSLWITGAGCMLGCEGMVATAATAGNGPDASSSVHFGHSLTIVATGHACSSNDSSAVSSEVRKQSHDCCKQNRAEPLTEPQTERQTEPRPDIQRTSSGAATIIQSGASSSGMTGDCPLASSKTAVVVKSRRSEARAPQLVAYSYLPAQNFLEQSYSLSTPRLLPNRGHTYLRCCVFLI